MRNLVLTLLITGAFAAAPGAEVASLSWMSGCWAGSAMGGLLAEEQWSSPVSGQMMGMGRMIGDGKVVFAEFMRIEQKNGKVIYVTLLDPKQPVVEFTAVRQSASEVVFENPAHDFPQRIIYRKSPGGGLFARIEGVEKGKNKAEDFPFKPARCGAPPPKPAAAAKP